MIQEDYHADSATFKMTSTSLKSEHEIRLPDIETPSLACRRYGSKSLLGKNHESNL